MTTKNFLVRAIVATVVIAFFATVRPESPPSLGVAAALALVAYEAIVASVAGIRTDSAGEGKTGAGRRGAA